MSHIVLDLSDEIPEDEFDKIWETYFTEGRTGDSIAKECYALAVNKAKNMIADFPAFVVDRSKPAHCAVPIAELERLRAIEAAGRRLIGCWNNGDAFLEKAIPAWESLEKALDVTP